MNRAILILFLALPFCLSAQKPLRFIGEKIDFEIDKQRFSIDGLYFFLNNTEKEKRQTILFPFSEKADSLIVKRVYNLTYSENIEYQLLKNAIVFMFNILPGDTVKINIAYSQQTMKENVYILKSTRTWNEALERADYSLTFDNSIQIENLSLKPDSLKNDVYYWSKKDFYPNEDFIVRIK
jgi:hypothetical protein